VKLPWTHEELQALQQKLTASIETFERDYPEVRPLPPMEEAEAQRLLMALTEAAIVRQLTVEESTLIGQLLCCYRMAVIASVLKRRGRYFVFSEDELTALMGKYGANAG
jgi:hypothetical protein